MMRKDEQSPDLSAAVNTGNPPTLKDIAFMTGLAVTTVSRALKDAPDIGQATKERVRLVAQQIGYRPNRAGVRLRTGKTNVIALIISIEAEPMGLTPHMVSGISQVLDGTAYHLILTPYDTASDPMEPVRYVVETGSADGIIISRTEPDDPRVRYLQERNFPFATHGRTNASSTHAYHDFDNKRFAEVAVKRLAERGRQRLSILHPPLDLNYGRDMLDGYGEQIDALELDDVSLRGLHIDMKYEDVRDGIARIMKSRQRPDGIICASAAAVLSAVAGIEQAGLTVGEDIDIVGKESFDLLRKFRSSISMVEEDFREAGRRLAEAVIGQINGKPATEFQTLEVPGP